MAVPSQKPYDQRLAGFVPQDYKPHNHQGPRILSNGKIYNSYPNTNAGEPPPQAHTFDHLSQPPLSTSDQSPEAHSFKNPNQGVGIDQQPSTQHSLNDANQSAPLASNQLPVPSIDSAPARPQNNSPDDNNEDKKEGHSWHEKLKNTAEILDDVKDIVEAFGGHGGHGHRSGHGTSHGHSHGS